MKHRNQLRSTLLCAGLLFCAAPALAARAHELPARAVPALQQLEQATGTAWTAEWDGNYEQLRSVRGRWQGQDRDPERAARRFLHQARDALGLAPGLGDLRLVHSKRSPAGWHLQFAQTARGLAVFDGGIDVHLAADGAVFLVRNRYARSAALAGLPASAIVSEKSALAAAAASERRRTDKAGRVLQGGNGATVLRTELGIRRGARGLDLAWRFHADGHRFVVSATTGAVLARVPMAQSATGSGRVFDPNPVNTLNDTSLRDSANADYAALQGAYFTRTLPGIEQLSNPVRYRLRGPYVRAFDATANYFANSYCDADGGIVAQAPPVRTTTAFLYARNQVAFEHTMVYLHIDRSQRHIRSLGFTDLLSTGIAVDAHAFTADNSFFCPGVTGTGYLAFGNGGVDDAEDADVILHEYGHALQDDASGGRYDGVDEAGAMGEGFGDYWAFQAKPGGFKPACFAEWDVADGTCLRRLDRNKHYPGAYVGEVHDDGEIWSRALRDLYLAVGRPVANTIILGSHFLVPVAPNFDEGAQALLDADTEIYGGTHAAAICIATTARGFAAADC